MPEKIFTRKRKGTTMSSGLIESDPPPWDRPIRTSSSYVREMLHVSKEGATVLGRGMFSQYREGTFHSLPTGSEESPSGMFMLDLLIITQLRLSERLRSCART